MTPTRVLRTSQVTLTQVFAVDETATDCAGDVDVSVFRGDGTEITNSPFTAGHPGTGTYTLALPGQADLDLLGLTWSGSLAGATVEIDETVEIVGGFLVSLAAARRDPVLRDLVKYPTAALVEARVKAEMECEIICGQAFVPRYRRAVCSGHNSDTLILPDTLIRGVRSVTVAGVALDAGELAALSFTETGRLIRPVVWPAGTSNVIVEYEYGMDACPPDLSDAVLARMRSILTRPKSGLPPRVASYVTGEGTTFRLAKTDRTHTGEVDVDAVFERWTRAPRAVVA